jgi:hypothetical protein
MITPIFGFTKDFAKEWNNRVYFRLSKILCGFKDQVRARPSGEKCGLAPVYRIGLQAAEISVQISSYPHAVLSNPAE